MIEASNYKKVLVRLLVLAGLVLLAVVEIMAADPRLVEFLPSAGSVSSYLGQKNSNITSVVIEGQLVFRNAGGNKIIRPFEIKIDLSSEAGAAFFASCLMHPNITIIINSNDAMGNGMSVSSVDNWLLAPYPNALELGVEATLTGTLKTSDDQMAGLLKPCVEKVSSDLGIAAERANGIVNSLVRLVNRQAVYLSRSLNVESDSALSAQISALYRPVSLKSGLFELKEISRELSTSAVLQILKRDFQSQSIGLQEKHFIEIYIKTLIVELKDQGILNQLIVDFKDSDVEPILSSLLQKISEYPSPVFLEFVLSCIDSDSSDVAYQALFALHELGIPNLPELPLFRVFKENPREFKAQYEPVVNLLRKDLNKKSAATSDAP